MPERSLLEEIKESIQNIGNEKKAAEEKNLPFNDTDIPGEPEKSNIKNIKNEEKSKREGKKDKKEKEINAEEVINGDLISDISDETDKESKTEDIKDFELDMEDLASMEQSVDSSKVEKKINDLDSILDKISEDQNFEDDSSKELSALLGESFESSKEPKEKLNDNLADDLKEMDALFGDSSMSADENPEDKTGEEFKFDVTEEPESPIEINEALSDLAGDFTDKDMEEKEISKDVSIDNIMEGLGEENQQISEISDLDSLSKETDQDKIELPEDIDSFDIHEKQNIEEQPIEQPGEETTEQSSINEPISEESIMEENFFPEGKEEVKKDEGFEEKEDKFNLDDLGDLSGIGIESTEGTEGTETKKDEEKTGFEDLSADKILEEANEIGSFDFESLESISPKEEEAIPIFKEKEEAKEDKGSFFDSSTGKMPEELSHEEIKKDEDIVLKLSGDERKQILISLTSLPKDAELKISKAIVSGKYSNRQLKPLINSLIDKESPSTIIRYYEKITGDRSLIHISGIKYTGEKFEERQKTFSYILQKNLFPVITIILTAGVLILGGFILFFKVISPTLEANMFYSRAKKNLKEKVFWEVEKDFEKAFNIQPRYKEAVDFARGYRLYKRYLEAEKKYELAYNMNPDKIDLALEYADFFREKKDFERSEKKYKDILKYNPKNIDAMLGLARNYFDWSDEQKSRLNDAKEMYYDVLDLDKNNKEAIYGKLNIFIEENNYKEVMKHYRYIEKNFGKKKVDAVIYAKLAEYLINIGEVDNVKTILNKAAKSLKKKELLPELDYQLARYKKLLNVFDEEKVHLQNALKQFDRMKELDNDRYNSPQNQKLLAKIYNDTGENYERFESTSIDAEEYYKRAINIDPDYGRSYYNLANFNFNYKTDKDGYLTAKENYEIAEKKGFSNDTLNFNLGWLYYKDNDYERSYQRIISILDLNQNNSNLKFMIGTIYYKLANYDLAESILLETYIHFDDLSQKNYPLEIEVNEDKMIMEMLEKISNNLGAIYQKKFETSGKSKYLVTATKYYSESINHFNKLQTDTGVDNPNSTKNLANINLRMVLYPDAGTDEPLIYENFPIDFTTTM